MELFELSGSGVPFALKGSGPGIGGGPPLGSSVLVLVRFLLRFLTGSNRWCWGDPQGFSDAYLQDPESVSGSQNDVDEWQRYEEEAEYPSLHRSISTIVPSIITPKGTISPRWLIIVSMRAVIARGTTWRLVVPMLMRRMRAMRWRPWTVSTM